MKIKDLKNSVFLARRAQIPGWLILFTIALCVSPLLLGPLGASFQMNFALKSDVAWHVGIEMVGIMCGFLAAALAVAYFNIRKNPSILIIGLGCAGAACFDLYHVLVSSDIIDIGPVDPTLRTSSGIMSRLFIPILLMTGVHAGKYVAKAGSGERLRTVLILMSAVYAAIGFGILKACFSACYAMKLFYPDSPVSRPFDGIVALALHVCAIFVLLKHHRRERSIFSETLLLVQLPLISAVLAITLQGLPIFNNALMFAHIFKVYAYALPFAAICLEFVTTYRNTEALASQKFGAAESMIALQNAKMSHSSKLAALGEMAGGIAHEINTPLAVIQLNAIQLVELLEEGEVDPLVVLTKLHDIETTTERIARIVRSLRKVSRDGSQDPIQHTGLREIFNGVRDLCDEKLKSHSIRLTMMSADRLMVDCRPIELSQVLLNLVQNACDAVGQLPERWVIVSAEDLGSVIELTVTDSGSGIPLENRERILQPFFTTKEIGKGTGLGLSIAKSIMEGYKGSLELDEKSPTPDSCSRCRRWIFR